MIITKKRIRALGNYTNYINDEQKIILCLSLGDIEQTRMLEIGFTESMEVGERILPESVGPISNFNANGKEIPMKNQPKETHTRQREWTWKKWSGRGQTKEV